jgi:hypothetical protein
MVVCVAFHPEQRKRAVGDLGFGFGAALGRSQQDCINIQIMLYQLAAALQERRSSCVEKKHEASNIDAIRKLRTIPNVSQQSRC